MIIIIIVALIAYSYIVLAIAKQIEKKFSDSNIIKLLLLYIYFTSIIALFFITEQNLSIYESCKVASVICFIYFMFSFIIAYLYTNIRYIIKKVLKKD